MKYRVKFICHWYGIENHDYEKVVEFYTIGAAVIYKQRVDLNFKILTDKSKPGKELLHFRHSPDFIKIEDGFIKSEAKIFRVFEEREEEIN